MEFILRNINPNNLLTGLLLASILLLVVTKYFFPFQFTDLLNITQNHKYVTLYTKSKRKISVFNPLMYLFFAINCSLFFYLSAKKLQIEVVFFNLFIMVNVYVLGLYFIKKIGVKTLGIGSILTFVIFQKITFNHYIGIVFFIFNLISLYINPSPSTFYTYGSFVFIGILYVFMLFLIVAQNLKWVLRHWFYFILYLCTFKISPLLVGGFLLSR